MDQVSPMKAFTRVTLKERTVTRELRGLGVVTLPENSALVSVRTVMIRNASNPNDAPATIRRLFSHPAGQKDEEIRDKMFAAMGRDGRAIVTLKPHQNGPLSLMVMKESPEYLYLHSAFVKTFMLINEQNITNGCIPVPPEVCAVQNLPKVATLFDPQGVSFNLEVDYYVLVPFDHILAWCLRVNDMWRRKKGLFALEMTVSPQNGGDAYILYYVVANQSFDLLKKRCLEGFVVGKHDCRRMDSCGFELVGGPEPISVTASFTVVEYPTGVDPATIAPVLHPDFVPYSYILQKEVDLARGQKEEEEYEKRTKKAL